MNLPTLSAISPVDGRYRKVTDKLGAYFSESALIKYRLQVEIEYFIALSALGVPRLQALGKKTTELLRAFYVNFSLDDARKIKEIEKTTNHDVKAVEYFLKEKFDEAGLSDVKEFIHFGLTSQDVNNTAIPALMKDAFINVLEPGLNEVLSSLEKVSTEWKGISMLARTHGQPASPTTLGKEMYVFVDRIKNQMKQLKRVPFSAKFGGATGNFNAHYVAYPKIDWHAFGDSFVEKNLGLKRAKVTTQIEHYDNLAALFDSIKRIYTILIDLTRDVWAYISINYFKQRIKEGEVGSS
ncbi:MAG: lyase family protein, partial [Nitrospinota bacterium]